ncbi:MAG: hypothetical protein EOM54_12770 [Clostridia bacterium]|nr:hypothetical protein [Clostridia bacterium]
MIDVPRFYTVKSLETKVNAYFASCAEENKKPNKQGLAVYLNVFSETLDDWAKESAFPGFSPVIKKAFNRMSDLFQQRTDSMAMISVRQPCYGGFVDKPAVSADSLRIEVKIDGCGADPFG